MQPSTKSTKIPPIIQAGAWLLSLIVFAVGFWHTHLGLKQMNLFESKYGTIAIAAIVLIFILISYWFAVNRGNMAALSFYIICSLFVFIFNLNYIYPAYMGRNLVNEEAKTINDTLQSYANRAQADNSFSSSEYTELTLLRGLVPSIIGEIVDLNGKGAEAQRQIDQFNSICKKFGVDANVSVSGGVGSTQTAKEAIASQLKQKLISSLDAVLKSGLNGHNSDKIVEGNEKLSNLQKEYASVIEEIQLDKSDIILDSVKTHPQINNLLSLVKGVDEATSLINEGYGVKKYQELDSKKIPSTQFLGQIEHTLLTIKSRIDRISTWAMILICLFIDLLVPLGIYLLLRKKETDIEPTQKIKPEFF